MTISELINMLENYPAHMQVFVTDIQGHLVTPDAIEYELEGQQNIVVIS